MQVELDRVHKRFGALEALRDVSLTLETGHAVALVGPNGSGKSTLTRAVMGLIDHHGAIRFDGRPRRHSPGLSLRVAYVPQIAPQIAAPVAELVRTVCATRAIDPREVAAVTRALDLDLDRIARQGFRTLSGGMKQKLLIALALAPGVDLLLMDEPTASLDAAARGRFFEVFAERRRGATLVLTSHRLEEIRHLVDDVVALRDGAVTYHGRADAFLAGHEQSVIELYADAGEHAPWLHELGFVPGAAGWWVKVVGRDEKLRTLPALFARLNGRVANVVVRDFERLDPVPSADAAPPTHAAAAATASPSTPKGMP